MQQHFLALPFMGWGVWWNDYLVVPTKMKITRFVYYVDCLKGSPRVRFASKVIIRNPKSRRSPKVGYLGGPPNQRGFVYAFPGSSPNHTIYVFAVRDSG